MLYNIVLHCIVWYCNFCRTDKPSDQETYWLFGDVCDIPTSVELRLRLVNVSRAVCRSACSEVHDKHCSGFLYSRRERLCTLSPYTGERLPSTTVACDSTSGLEFYRRSRLLSTTFHVGTVAAQRIALLQSKSVSGSFCGFVV